MKSSGSRSSGSGMEMKSSGGSAKTVERKTVEKQRRMQMKSLCVQLASLLPSHLHQHQKDAASQVHNLEEAASYIVNLRDRIDQLRRRRRRHGLITEGCDDDRDEKKPSAGATVQVRCGCLQNKNPNLEVVLLTPDPNRFALHKALRLVEEEGANVVSASLSSFSDQQLLLCTIHSHLPHPTPAFDVSSLTNRLRQCI